MTPRSGRQAWSPVRWIESAGTNASHRALKEVESFPRVTVCQYEYDIYW